MSDQPPAHDQETCPSCGGGPSYMEIRDVDLFDPAYDPDKDQSETYFVCDDCDTEWRLEE